MEYKVVSRNRINGSIDVLKFILSMIVVSIHTVHLPVYLIPLVRAAVPVFFLISSYFFFNHGTKVGKFIKRNLALYAFWLLVQSPVVLYLRGYHTMGIFRGSITFVRDLIFGSTFGASWYIMAGVIAIVILFYVSQYVSNSTLLVGVGVVYIICCLFSNYYGLLEKFGLEMICDQYSEVFHEPYNSFPVALFWCGLGKLMTHIPIKSTNKKCLHFVLLGSVVLLLGEQMMIEKLGCSAATDCYLMLPLVCVSLFLLVRDCSIQDVKYSEIFRKCSTIIYVSHVSVSIVVGAMLHIFWPTAVGMYIYVLTLCACLFICVLILWLQKRFRITWLKWIC